ncbi:HAD family hydrolase [Candidatus Pacearchaeota archaeon]|nr:HAD family hydrolase [Candidatus Pacearchaeota archaeon]
MRVIQSPLLIFDFDGTIVDSKQAYYHAFNKNLNVIGMGRKEVDRAIDLGLSLNETIKKFVPIGIYRWWIRRKIMREVISRVRKIKKCRDINEIERINARKILVSNSLSEFVRPVLNHLRINKDFEEIYCADDFSNKEQFIMEYLRKNRIDKNKCYYVGDRAADAKLARKVGCKSIIISGKCSWDSRKEIMNAKPDFIVSSIDEISRIIE